MGRASIFSGVAFRTALLFLVVFAVVLAVAGYAILRGSQATMEDQIHSYITEDVELMRDANIAGGQRELMRFIRDSLATRADRQFAFGLYTTQGRRIAGNTVGDTRFLGWGTVEIAQAPGEPFIAYAERLEDAVVIVGRSQGFVETMTGAIVNQLILAGVVICTAALVIGGLLSHGVSSKLAVIDRVLGEVSHGNADARVPVGRSNDQIDHVSRQINDHLDRLGELMATMRNTIVAIAHDLKSPLNRAYILLQDAAEDSGAGSERTKLQNAQAEMETLREVLDTVLRISRIETSNDNSNFAAFSPAALVRDLAQTFEPVIEAAGQTLRFAEVQADAGPIFGDRKMVQQMLVNLIENASRYGGDGAVIDLGVRTANGWAVVSVADNGPGIPASQREVVFEPFRRLNPSRNSPGAGLGLALVKAVAVRHRAKIELSDNQPGLRITLSFPPAA